MALATSPTTVALGSLVALAGLIAGLWWREQQTRTDPIDRPLIVFVAPTSRLPIEAIAADYERETGQRVELRFGPSEDILTKVRFPAPGEPADLFLPADDSYIALAREKELVAETLPLAKMQAVVITRPGLSPPIETWSDLVQSGRKLGLANPDAAAISKLTTCLRTWICSLTQSAFEKPWPADRACSRAA